MEIRKLFYAICFPPFLFGGIWLLLWLWMRLVLAVYPGDLAPDPVFRPYLGVAPTENLWLAVWQRWDALHYQAIAERGYAAFSTALFTPPLYPWLMRLVSYLVGDTLLAGLLLSALFYGMGWISFYRLAQYELRKEQLAQRAVVYLSLFPTSFFFFAPYTESMFLLGSVAFLLALRQKRWLAAGLWGSLTVASRLVGATILLPAAWSLWREWRGSQRLGTSWLALVLPLLTALSFPLYVHFGMGKSFWAPFLAQTERFHGGFTWPGFPLIAAVRQVVLGEMPLPNLLDLLFTLFFVVYAFPVWKRLPRLYGIYYAGFLVLYLSRMAAIYPLLSMPRYVLALFPIFLVLAQQGEDRWVHRLIVYLSLIGLLFFSAQFAVWGWVG